MKRLPAYLERPFHTSREEQWGVIPHRFLSFRNRRVR